MNRLGDRRSVFLGKLQSADKTPIADHHSVPFADNPITIVIEKRLWRKARKLPTTLIDNIAHAIRLAIREHIGLWLFLDLSPLGEIFHRHAPRDRRHAPDRSDRVQHLA